MNECQQTSALLSRPVTLVSRVTETLVSLVQVLTGPVQADVGKQGALVDICNFVGVKSALSSSTRTSQFPFQSWLLQTPWWK